MVEGDGDDAGGAGRVALREDDPEAPPQATTSMAVAASARRAAMSRTRRTGAMVDGVTEIQVTY